MHLTESNGPTTPKAIKTERTCRTRAATVVLHLPTLHLPCDGRRRPIPSSPPFSAQRFPLGHPAPPVPPPLLATLSSDSASTPPITDRITRLLISLRHSSSPELEVQPH
ncbi:hypothetical protein CRG98_030339 [Punica granatum]|uniref:Uncharacterized protein n=1 Tax=Punica granatum TaxID=22663 RepID=A0A2I0J0Q2_PUNGR|nr:hypothetical protein CRG98_030339 [Punica granatum]